MFRDFFFSGDTSIDMSTTDSSGEEETVVEAVEELDRRAGDGERFLDWRSALVRTMAASMIASSSSVAVGLVMVFLLPRWRVRRVLGEVMTASVVAVLVREAVAELALVGMAFGVVRLSRINVGC